MKIEGGLSLDLGRVKFLVFLFLATVYFANGVVASSHLALFGTSTSSHVQNSFLSGDESQCDLSEWNWNELKKSLPNTVQLQNWSGEDQVDFNQLKESLENGDLLFKQSGHYDRDTFALAIRAELDRELEELTQLLGCPEGKRVEAVLNKIDSIKKRYFCTLNFRTKGPISLFSRTAEIRNGHSGQQSMAAKLKWHLQSKPKGVFSQNNSSSHLSNFLNLLTRSGIELEPSTLNTLAGVSEFPSEEEISAAEIVASFPSLPEMEESLICLENARQENEGPNENGGPSEGKHDQTADPIDTDEMPDDETGNANDGREKPEDELEVKPDAEANNETEQEEAQNVTLDSVRGRSACSFDQLAADPSKLREIAAVSILLESYDEGARKNFIASVSESHPHIADYFNPAPGSYGGPCRYRDVDMVLPQLLDGIKRAENTSQETIFEMQRNGQEDEAQRIYNRMHHADSLREQILPIALALTNQDDSEKRQEILSALGHSELLEQITDAKSKILNAEDPETGKQIESPSMGRFVNVLAEHLETLLENTESSTEESGDESGVNNVDENEKPLSLSEAMETVNREWSWDDLSSDVSDLSFRLLDDLNPGKRCSVDDLLEDSENYLRLASASLIRSRMRDENEASLFRSNVERNSEFAKSFWFGGNYNSSPEDPCSQPELMTYVYRMWGMLKEAKRADELDLQRMSEERRTSLTAIRANALDVERSLVALSFLLRKDDRDFVFEGKNVEGLEESIGHLVDPVIAGTNPVTNEEVGLQEELKLQVLMSLLGQHFGKSDSSTPDESNSESSSNAVSESFSAKALIEAPANEEDSAGLDEANTGNNSDAEHVPGESEEEIEAAAVPEDPILTEFFANATGVRGDWRTNQSFEGFDPEAVIGSYLENYIEEGGYEWDGNRLISGARVKRKKVERQSQLNLNYFQHLMHEVQPTNSYDYLRLLHEGVREKVESGEFDDKIITQARAAIFNHSFYEQLIEEGVSGAEAIAKGSASTRDSESLIDFSSGDHYMVIARCAPPEDAEDNSRYVSVVKINGEDGSVSVHTEFTSWDWFLNRNQVCEDRASAIQHQLMTLESQGKNIQVNLSGGKITIREAPLQE